MPEPAEQKDWKQNYRELVRELDAKERAWNGLAELLRGAARKLAITAMGQSPVLDEQLQAIVAELRSDFDPANLTEALDALGNTLSRLPRVKDASDSDARIALIMSDLVDRMAENPGLAAASLKLKQLHANAVASNDWAALVGRMAETLAESVSALEAQKRELETFLEAMTEQLKQLDDWVSWNRGIDERRTSDSFDLENTVEHEVEGIRREVAETRDIGDLKRRVQARIEAVAMRVRQFRADESARQAEIDRRNAELNQEIDRLRARTTDLSRLVEDREQKLLLDELTQVHSRYAYERRLEEEFRRWQRTAEPLSFAIWDLDEFKAINDRYGHPAGDRLLQIVGRILNVAKRAEDFVARVGGEEFVLLTPSTSLEGALELADRIRLKIAETPFHYHGNPERVTISCGLAAFRSGDTPQSVFERADAALFEAKRSGRNRCIAR